MGLKRKRGVKQNIKIYDDTDESASDILVWWNFGVKGFQKS